MTSRTLVLVTLVFVCLTASIAHGRAYSPARGRFLQRDSAGWRDGPNVYEYVQSRPVVARDPTGLVAVPCVGACRCTPPPMPIAAFDMPPRRIDVVILSAARVASNRDLWMSDDDTGVSPLSSGATPPLLPIRDVCWLTNTNNDDCIACCTEHFRLDGEICRGYRQAAYEECLRRNPGQDAVCQAEANNNPTYLRCFGFRTRRDSACIADCNKFWPVTTSEAAPAVD